MFGGYQPTSTRSELAGWSYGSGPAYLRNGNNTTNVNGVQAKSNLTAAEASRTPGTTKKKNRRSKKKKKKISQGEATTTRTVESSAKTNGIPETRIRTQSEAMNVSVSAGTTKTTTNSKKKRQPWWINHKAARQDTPVNVVTNSETLKKPESETCGATNTTSGTTAKRKRGQTKKQEKGKLDSNSKDETQEACVKEVVVGVKDNDEGSPAKKMKIDVSNARNTPTKKKKKKKKKKKPAVFVNPIIAAHIDSRINLSNTTQLHPRINLSNTTQLNPSNTALINNYMGNKAGCVKGKGGGVANITPKSERINYMGNMAGCMMGKGGGVANITPKSERINYMGNMAGCVMGKGGGVANITPKSERINDMGNKAGCVMGKGGGVANITPKSERINDMGNKAGCMMGKGGGVANITPKLESVGVQGVEGGTGKNTPAKKKRQDKDTPIQQQPEETVTKKMGKMNSSTGGGSSSSSRPMGISNSRPNITENPKLNVSYAETSRKEAIRACWSGKEGLLETQVEDIATVIEYPFTCCHLPSFLSSPTYLDKVYDELLDLKMISKNNDLYKFQQSNDLKTVTSPHLAGLKRFLYGEFREWLIHVTGIPLTPTVDMSCSQYQYTDVLLCHDDELEGRRVAFILYLVPPWSYDDGGTLDLFDVNEFGQPLDVVHSIVPQKNSFAFFEVSPISFHQVSEVVSQKKRVSINGWFHGPPIKRPMKDHLSPRIEVSVPMFVEEEEVYSWINPQYLEPKIQHQVRKEFAEKSALELDNFFSTDCFAELAQALQSPDLPWTNHGPANRQSYQSLERDDAPEKVKSAVKLLHSEAMFLILSQLTGLKLHSLAPPDSDPDSDEDESGTEPNPRGNVSIRQWGHRSYTLVRDDCLESKSVLDAHLFVNVPKGWTQEHGGFVSYLAKDEDEELLTVVPRENCLALVYRDAETLTFTKYINHRVTELGGAEASYQTLNGAYYE
ncbi:hypothetical protein Pcinc_028406 [Petrolisthes cinctipes]|uniref:uS12 prolyl 3-hydroxylase n=1 Tax=Petrolisthes cinctipes TaxID=88211 RepID=A0AAE1K5F2_PETCI|nr:hypothetical protein Pcinc_028406 [Petrolisthes cinctipes]